jgi:MltA-interacting protein MipA
MRTAGLALALLAQSPALAQEVPPPADAGRSAPSVDAGVETDASSLYLFRGLVYSNGPVTQSKSWVSIAGLNLYAWSNVAMTPAAYARRLDEVDVGASYAFERGPLTVEPAFDCYLYRLSDSQAAAGAVARTAEVSVTVSYATGGATVSTRQALDTGSYGGAYFGELGASYDHSVSSRIEIGVSARVGWASSRFNRKYIGPEEAALGLAGAGVSITRRFGRHFYVRPHAEITTVPDASLRAHLARPTNGIVGVVLGIAR